MAVPFRGVTGRGKDQEADKRTSVFYLLQEQENPSPNAFCELFCTSDLP